MNQDFMLRVLGEIMNWPDGRANEEFPWLRLMSQIKYDGYQDFRAGARFIESLTDWLQQFKPHERQAAYDFVRKSLVFVSQAEMNHLVELFYPEKVQRLIAREATRRHNIPEHMVWAHPGAAETFKRLLRQSLFIELSDGARIDVFRRANSGIISNEQIVTAPRIITTKWNELLSDLQSSLDAKDAKFFFVFLIDDFVGSGYTLLRREPNGWTGKLARFIKDLQENDVWSTHFETGWVLCVHHYLSTHKASKVVRESEAECRSEKQSLGEPWFERVEFEFGSILPENLPISGLEHQDFLRLVETYYDPAIETKHMKKLGKNARLGFGDGALPLILEHNTPNNSLALLWADTIGSDTHPAMRPLFRRRQRHV